MIRIIILWAVIGCTWVRAGIAITLVPQQPQRPGGYVGGETINIDVLAQLTKDTPSVPGPGGTTTSIRVRLMQFDLADSSPELDIRPVSHHELPKASAIPFWDMSAAIACFLDVDTCGTNYFIDGDIASDNILNITYIGLVTSSSMMLQLNQEQPRRVGEFQVTLPTEPGTYILDVLNADEADINQGAEAYWGFGTAADPTDPTSPLRANTGGLTGGRLYLGPVFPPGPDCNNNGKPDFLEDCNFNEVPDSCETSCKGDTCNCQGPYGGQYAGASTGTIVSSLNCAKEMQFKFVTNHGPILFQTSATMNEDGVITGAGTKIQINGQFDFDDCSASGTWSLLGGEPGTWSMRLTRECLPDCNANDVPDSCDIRDEFSLDCNDNSLPDECDLVNGASFDCNHNEVPDECEDPPVFAIVMSDPAHGTVDVRQDRSITGQTQQGIDRVRMQFSCTPHDALTGEPFTTDSFDVVATSGIAPLVFTIQDAGEGNTYDILLSDPIPPGAWTTITANVVSPDGVAIDPDAMRVSLGFLPGDVNGNGRSLPADILALIDHLNGIRVPPLLSSNCDMDRSGQCAPGDIVRLIDLLNGINTSRAWLGVGLPTQP